MIQKNKISIYSVLDKLLIFIVVFGIILFILYPIYSVIITSLFDKGEFTLKFYQQLFTGQNLKLIKNSLFVTISSSLITLIVSLSIALFSFTRSEKSKNRIKKMLILTMISPPFVSSLAFIMLFGRRGLITYKLLGLSLNPYGWQGIVALQAIGSVSFATMMLVSSLDNIDFKLILASRDLGANMSKTLFKIIIPQVMPTILSVLFILFTINLSDFGTPIVIGGRYKVLATEAYLQILSSSSLGKAAAISMIMIPPSIIAFYFYKKALKMQGNLVVGSKLQQFTDYKYTFPVTVKTVITTIFFLYLGIMVLKYSNIFLSAISNTATGQIRFTTSYLTKLPRSFISSFINSLIYAIIAAISSTFIGILISYYTHRRNIKFMTIIEFISSLPYIIPGTFFGLGYVAAFSKPPFLLSGTAIIIISNIAFRQVSVANKAANAAFSSIDSKIEFAAKDLGASHVQSLFGIIIPILKPVILNCFITIFTTSMTAVGAIVFLISPGKNVASVEMFQSIENGRYGVAAVQAIIIIIVTVCINLMAMRLLKKHTNSSNVGGKDVFTAE